MKNKKSKTKRCGNGSKIKKGKKSKTICVVGKSGKKG